MFKGYKLSKVDFGDQFDALKDIGQAIFNEQKKNVVSTLDDFFLRDKSLDAVKIVEYWFPKISAHVFISHSNKDQGEVLALAGWLKKNCNITSFIDSCVWGYGNKLIQVLDNKYSWFNDERKVYAYNKVLYSASHVHMMLSTALNSMIDKTECLIFYDTPNSIQSFENINRTESPWIYSEIAFSETVRLNYPPRLNDSKNKTMVFATGGKVELKEDLKIRYELNTKHLKEIDAVHLNNWRKSGPYRIAEDALDKFYELTFPFSK